MTIVRELLRNKSADAIFSVTPGTSVLEAMQLLADRNIGAVLVMENEKIVGILSERDIVRKVELAGKTCAAVTVGEIMTAKVLYIEANQPLEECMAVMTEKRIRHLPVMDNGKLLGVISIGDVLREVIHEQKFMISQLEHYIRGGQ